MKLKIIAAALGILLYSTNVTGSAIYTTDYLNLRRGPSTKYDVVTTLKPDTELLKVTSGNNWDKVRIGKKEYYVCNKYVTEQRPKKPLIIKVGVLKNLTQPKTSYLGSYELTAYCSCGICCGSWGGTTTASGTTPTAGRTVACNSLSFGTKIMINNHIYTVEDTGGMAGNVIDIYLGDHEAALQFGRQTADVYLVE